MNSFSETYLNQLTAYQLKLTLCFVPNDAIIAIDIKDGDNNFDPARSIKYDEKTNILTIEK